MSARIISWMASWRSALCSGCSKSLKNMCSVRQRPMPSAPMLRALRASWGVSALVRTRSLRISSAHSIRALIGFWRIGADQARFAGVDGAFVAVESEPVAFIDDAAVGAHAFCGGVDIERFGADDAAFAPAAGDYCGVAGFSAGGGEDALRYEHAADIFGAGFAADQNYFFSSGGPVFGFFGGEDGLARLLRQGRR